MEKKIHYCWFGGKPLSRKVKQCIKTWKKFLPDYEIIEWNENNFDINICPFVKQAYENKKWAFVSDYARIYALYQQSGIYLDTDVKILKDVSHIVDKEMFFGYEDSGLVGTAIIGVKEKNNKYIKEILDYYNKLEEFNPDMMYNYANPVIITKAIKKYDHITDEKGIDIFDNNIYVYPRDYFFPLSYNYAEREFTENTCMVHLFNATWTSLGERRTIGIYRKFGPNIGKVLNNFIDYLGRVKFNIKAGLLKFYKWARMWVSIHINRNRRVKKISKIIDNLEGNEVLICNPDREYGNKYLKNSFSSVLFLREQHTEKEAKKLAKKLCESGKKTIVFNSLSKGWDRLITNIKRENRKINIKVITHGGNEQLINPEIWYIRDMILDLYAKKKVDEIIVFNKDLFVFYKNKGFDVSLLKRKVIIENKEKYKKSQKKDYIRIGMYENGYDCSKTIYNQLSAISLLDDVKLDYNPLNYEISMFARRFNINMTGDYKELKQKQLYSRLANNDINLCINLVDDDSLVPIESLELGIPCIIGNGYKYFENTELDNYIKVKDSENIEEIKEKITNVIDNKDKILDLYNQWKSIEKMA